MPSSGMFWIAAGAGALVIGYCVYFRIHFKKRSHSPPKLNLEMMGNYEDVQSSKNKKPLLNKPSLDDPESYLGFFLQEMQLGHHCLEIGDVPNGIKHLSNVLALFPSSDVVELVLPILGQDICQELTSHIQVAATVLKSPKKS